MNFDKYKTRGAYHYDWYAKGEPDWYKKCIDRIRDFCTIKEWPPERGTILDVGCGDGLLCDVLYERGAVVTGIDNNNEAIKLAKVRAPHSEYRLQDLAKPIKGKWDYMVCLNVIEHLEDPEAIKRIFNRNISKAAIIITDTPQENPSNYHIKEFSPYELKQMFYTRKVIPFRIDDNFHGIEVYK